MKIEVQRRASAEEKPYLASYEYEPDSQGETVATALLRLNETLEDPVRFECSCLQKKCGACAMVINGQPALACDVYLTKDRKRIRLEPLRKFPVVADLIVDRSVMAANLKKLGIYPERGAELNEKTSEDAYDAARCLQCGLCLEVCPNFDPEGDFTGAAGFVPASRTFLADPEPGESLLYKEYEKRVYAGCAKSLACQDICPAGIQTGERLAQSNAVAVWHRGLKKHR